MEKIGLAIVEAVKGDASAIAYLAYAMDVGAIGKWDDDLIVSLYQISAKKGNADAQFNLSQWYFEDSKEKDRFVMGLRWLCKSASQLDCRALCNLGAVYERGHLVPRNLRKAVELYKKSVSRKSCWGVWNYARFVYHGYVKKAEPKRAIRILKENRAWIEKAASQGDENAKKVARLISKALKLKKIAE